jgi:hypothetical protein
MEFGCGKAVVQLYDVNVLDADATTVAAEDIGSSCASKVITAYACGCRERGRTIATHTDCKQLN